MTIKRFLVPVLTLAAFGLPAGASVVAYCDGGGCGANTNAAFNSFVATNTLTYASVTDLAFTGSLISGGTQYNDGLTNVLFADSNTFTITGSNGLEATVKGDTILITVPAVYSAIRLSVMSGNAGSSFFTCLDSGCNNTAGLSSSTATAIGYVNTAPGSPWNIQINPFTGVQEQLILNNFDPAGAGGGSQTPEVGTLLLIGAGLISMRWMHRWPRRFSGVPRTA